MRSDAAIICEAMTSANAIKTHLAVAGCLIGAEKRPRRSGYEKALYDGYRVSLWLRFFAEESPKLDRAIDLPYASIKAIDDFVVQSKIWPDPLPFRPDTDRSAMSAAVCFIMDARNSGGLLLRTIEQIVGRNLHDLWSVESMQWQADALDASPAEIYRCRDDLRFAIEMHNREDGTWSSRFAKVFAHLEVERLRIEAHEQHGGDESNSSVWIPIKNASDLIPDTKTLDKYALDPDTYGVKRTYIIPKGGQRRRIKTFILSSRLNEYVKPRSLDEYRRIANAMPKQ